MCFRRKHAGNTRTKVPHKTEINEAGLAEGRLSNRQRTPIAIYPLNNDHLFAEA